MVRSDVAYSGLLVLVMCAGLGLELTAGVSAKTMFELQQITRNYVEHRVDEEEAGTAARTLQPELNLGRPGCEVCSREEIEYCTGTEVLEDHCCCDMRHFESFPYVPHTCYLRPGCRPNAGDCAQYTRLRVCCCDHITGTKWKSEADTLPTLSWRMFLLCSVGVLIVL